MRFVGRKIDHRLPRGRQHCLPLSLVVILVMDYIDLESEVHVIDFSPVAASSASRSRSAAASRRMAARSRACAAPGGLRTLGETSSLQTRQKRPGWYNVMTVGIPDRQLPRK